MPAVIATPTHLQQLLLVVCHQAVFAQLAPVAVFVKTPPASVERRTKIALPRRDYRVNLQGMGNGNRIRSRTSHLFGKGEVDTPLFAATQSRQHEAQRHV